MFKFFFRYFHDIEIAVESIISNKLKSMLTALGIIFGVAGCDSNACYRKRSQGGDHGADGNGRVNNILINPIIQDEGSSGSDNAERQQKKFSRGLSMLDVEAIREILPSVKRISPKFHSIQQQ